jgi:predicted Zn-dependent protease
MDLQNIATHELGHGFGLADLYNTQSQTQILQTMYGYASLGETMKRDLASGDIAGIRALYGR